MAKNVLGTELQACSFFPLTGYYRDGCCHTGEDDVGMHMVCAIVTDEFLQFTRQKGNDLITPRPEWNFPGLKAGDRWCLCVSRWIEAYHAKVAPPVVLEATHEKTLQYISLDILIEHSA
ncbi:MAG: DUF2237 domain-containing protein [Cytophagales bacterium]|nr:DUF2237 domain-containing protein [Bernardetiaceae bacterium]MDW8209476.1 DUF2237 domain-containing protein [Cytophagales bacterium]